MDAVEISEDWIQCLGREHFAGQHWIASHSSVRPCDLSPSLYMWGDNDIPEWGVGEDEFDLRRAPRFSLEQYSTTCQKT